MEFDKNTNLVFTWKLLTRWIYIGGEVPKRTTKNQVEYKKFNKSIKAKGISIDDFLFEKFFARNNTEYVFVLNDFPYNLEENIMHYLLWINPKNEQKFIDSSKIDFIIKEELKKKKIKYNKFLYNQNLYNERSVKTIKHFQVFVKLGN